MHPRELGKRRTRSSLASGKSATPPARCIHRPQRDTSSAGYRLLVSRASAGASRELSSRRSPALVPHTCAVSPTFRYGAFSFVAFALADSWSARLTSPAYPSGAKRSRRRRAQCGVQIRRALLSRNRRVANPDLVEPLRPLPCQSSLAFTPQTPENTRFQRGCPHKIPTFTMYGLNVQTALRRPSILLRVSSSPERPLPALARFIAPGVVIVFLDPETDHLVVHRLVVRVQRS